MRGTTCTNTDDVIDVISDVIINTWFSAEVFIKFMKFLRTERLSAPDVNDRRIHIYKYVDLATFFVSSNQQTSQPPLPNQPTPPCW